VTEQAVSGATDEERAAVVIAKVHVAKQLVDKARWGLLDAYIELDQLVAILMQAGSTRLHDLLARLDLTGPSANAGERTAQEYAPGSVERPEADCG
jgi:hypothetical protein